ncbi:MAG: SMC-Scp complex subunit ScpB [Suipraeoptans sp.]
MLHKKWGLMELEINKLEGAIEAILFSMGDSVELGKIAYAIGHDEETTRKLIHKMMDKYEDEDRGITIIELEDSFQMCTKKNMYDYLIKVAKQPRKYVLTDVLLETLSIIAYKQPVTKLEIEKIRGVKSDHAVNKLVEYQLIAEKGRLDAPGRPLLFGTTEEFLRKFSIHSIEDLPSVKPDEVETLKHQAEEEVQLKLNL